VIGPEERERHRQEAETKRSEALGWYERTGDASWRIIAERWARLASAWAGEVLA
jgi:hypothetical protein